MAVGPSGSEEGSRATHVAHSITPSKKQRRSKIATRYQPLRRLLLRRRQQWRRLLLRPHLPCRGGAQQVPRRRLSQTLLIRERAGEAKELRLPRAPPTSAATSPRPKEKTSCRIQKSLLRQPLAAESCRIFDKCTIWKGHGYCSS
ncbi:hypothetical protein KSP39_PZI023560 [Platanthera zijinensis]|uniref:Uncharacterized protein n=1 Tax=Platanthera zijinensis TaxID=2320716 RepID=A0AAP0ASK5_9ASPA